jgi:hypothetical protein
MGIAKTITPIILNYVWKIVTWKDGKRLNRKTQMVKMKHETKMKTKMKIWKGQTYTRTRMHLTMLQVLRLLSLSSAMRQGFRGMAWLSRTLSYQNRLN